MAPLLTLDAPTLTPRASQEEAIARVLDAWTRPARRALVVLPTGMDKTLIFASLLKRLNEPALILAHREELLTQAREKIRWLWPEADVGLISGNLGLDEQGHQITIASVPSMVRPHRLRALAASGIQTVIVDECHHSAARSYRTILGELRAGCMGGAQLLGVTATPDRGDKLATNEPGTLVIRRKVAIVSNGIGRGARNAPAKTDGLILDLRDQTSTGDGEPIWALMMANAGHAWHALSACALMANHQPKPRPGPAGWWF
jgi:superfamily II DNA or RNA helicase